MRKFQPIKLVFRKYKPSRHDALIGGESAEEYAFLRSTHSAFSGHKKNLKLKVNLDSRYPDESSYLTKGVQADSKGKFGPVDSTRTLSKEDEAALKAWFAGNERFKK